MAPDPELAAKIMKLRWEKGLSLKEAWAQIKRPKKKPEKKKEKKPEKKKEKKPEKKEERAPAEIEI